MRYSISLPGPDHVVGTDRILEIAATVEAAGLDACAVSDHPFPLLDETHTGHHSLDPFAALGAIAASTSRVLLHLNLVVLPYRSPFVVANAAATVDVLSGGRLLLGVGAGDLRAEFEALGVPFEIRNDLMDAGLAAMELAWTGGPVTTASPWWTASGNTILPPRGRRARPTIWIGGNTMRAMQRAVRFGDGWSPMINPALRSRNIHTATIDGFAALERCIEQLHAECRRAGRAEPPEVCVVQARGSLLRGSQTRADLRRLAELGVSWVCIAPVGETATEICSWVERFAERVRL